MRNDAERLYPPRVASVKDIEDSKVLMITISAAKSDPGQGVIHHEAPVARALLGSEEGDEVEVLNGPYVRAAVIEAIVKPNRITYP